MVQTRGQQTREESPSSRGALRDVTAEGDAASTSTELLLALALPSTEHSTAVLAGGGSGRNGPVSSHTISVSAPTTGVV